MEFGMTDRVISLYVHILVTADQAYSMDERKSTSGGTFFLGEKLVSWLSKKQDYISQSTSQEKYVVTEKNYNQSMWMKKMLRDIKIEIEELIIIYYDNSSTMSMSNNLVLHSKTTHISIQYHVLREKATKKEIILEYVTTKDWIADIFTKPLPKDTFKYLRGMVGVMLLPTLYWMMQKCISPLVLSIIIRSD